MMLPRLASLFTTLQLALLSLALAAPSSCSCCPRSITAVLFPTPSDQPCPSSARLLFRYGRIQPAASLIDELSGSGFSPRRLDSRSDELPSLPSALEHSAPNSGPDDGSASSSRIHKGSQAASIFWRFAWLVLLLYLLATTASDYFSFALEELSADLRLSPAVAGVTLLAFGTGAPDVFSSAASFLSSDSSDSIGFSSALGGALFVTTVVTGTVSLITSDVRLTINLFPFLRDALFLLVSVGVLTAIAIDGKVYLWEAIAFLCIYAVYGVEVSLEGYLQARTINCPSPDQAIEDLLLHKVAMAYAMGWIPQ